MKEGEILGLDRQATMGKARSILEGATQKAAQALEDLIEAPDDAIKLRASSEILDRVFGKKGEAGGAGTVVNITAEHVQLLNLALRESNNGYDVQPANDPPSQRSEGEHSDVPQNTPSGSNPQ